MIQLPASFEMRMKMILGPEFPEFCCALSSSFHHSIRINPSKVETPVNLEPVPYCSSGFYLTQRPIYTLDPLFHAGTYYVQESSSMFLEQFLLKTSRKNIRVLDLCASPGGKSTHLASLLPEDSLLVSNEVIYSRALILSENLKKWGYPNVVVTCNDPRDFSRLSGFFDIIVVDAPCSGEGLFRRDNSAIDEWSEANANHCAQRQKRILADVWPSLAEDGLLIYSTCTFNPAENEENMAWLSEFAPIESVKIEIPDNWGVVTSNADDFPGYHFYPHKVDGEGFFTAAMRKKGPSGTKFTIKGKSSVALAGKADQAILSPVIQQLPLSLIKFEENFLAIPDVSLAAFDQIRANLRIVHAGIKVGEIIRDSFIPAHELAISNICNHPNFPQKELSLDQAICYLKREDFQLGFSEKGWILLTYHGHPLGWAKNIGSRFNNGYPKEWRIRMSTTEFIGERLMLEAVKFPLK
jgi:16S rRNA C967 or C1407 C5-methylase (RsmB/RsmF family)/NOL1/NOP2/fmu family ribosome biogenesis protein